MKKQSKKKADKVENRAKKKIAERSEAEETTERNFDFGGLPERNLKKNLGC